MIVGRSFDELETKIKGFKDELKSSQTEIKAIDKALQLDPTNVDLVKQKYGLFSDQVKINQDRHRALQQQIKELNAEYANGNISQEEFDKQLKRIEQQSRLTETQITGLTGAIERQNIAISNAKYGDATKGARDLSKGVGNLTTMMGSLNAITGIAGTSSSAAGSAASEAMRQVTSGMSAVIGILPLMSKAVGDGASSYQRLATSATLAAGAVMMGIDLFSNWDDLSTTEKVIKSLSVALMVGAAAWTAFHGSWSVGIAVGAITAAVIGGIALIKSQSKSLGLNMPSEEPSTTGITASATSGYAIPQVNSKQEKRIVEATIKLEATGNTLISQENASRVASELALQLNKEFGRY